MLLLVWLFFNLEAIFPYFCVKIAYEDNIYLFYFFF